MLVVRALVVSALLAIPVHCKRSGDTSSLADEDQPQFDHRLSVVKIKPKSNVTGKVVTVSGNVQPDDATSSSSQVDQAPSSSSTDSSNPNEKMAKEVAARIAQDVTTGLEATIEGRVLQSIDSKIKDMTRVLETIQDTHIVAAKEEATHAAREGDADALIKAAQKMKSANSMKQVLVHEQEKIEREETPEGERRKSPEKYDVADDDAYAGEVGEQREGLLWHHHSGAPAPSITALCVVFLVCQYFIIHTGLAIARAAFQMSSSESEGVLLTTLEASTPSLSFVPMLCVLLFAVRLRVVYLAQGMPEQYDLPYWWVNWGQIGAVIGVFVQMCFVILVVMITGAPPAQDSMEEGKPMHVEVGNSCCSTFLTVIQYIGTIAVYLGAGLCCAGIILMRPPEEVEMHSSGMPVISIALHCVMMLSILYFVVFAALQCARTANHLRGDGHSKAQDVLQLASFVMRFIPMLAVLFMCVRIRATQIRPDYREPKWVDLPMIGCSGGMLLQTLFTIAVPSCCGGRARKGASEADISFEPGDGANRCCTGFFEFLRWIVLIGIYGGSSIVLISIFFMEDPDFPADTPKLDRAMQCTLVLTLLFFFVHLLFFMGTSCRQCGCCAGGEEGPARYHCLEVLETAVDTVEFSPMLCILFLSARLRAQLLLKADQPGHPQSWAQDAMILATLATLGQLIMVLFRACLPAASNVETGDCVRGCWAFLEVLRFMVMIGTFGGAGIVIFAMVTMTPDAASEVNSSWFFPEHMSFIDDQISSLHPR